MPEMKGITVKIPADLHAEVKAYLEAHGMTMGEFIAQAVDHEMHPKLEQEDKNMERMRTLAFQVPDSLFQRVKAYLERNHMTQLKKPEHALKLFLRFVLAKAAVGYGLDLMLAIFSIVQGIVSTIIGQSGLAGSGGASLPQAVIDKINSVGFWDSIPLWIVTLLGSLFITVLSFVMILTVYSRMFKLFIFAAIAPIPLSTFAGEPTSNIGKNFLRSYAGACLEGAVIALACIIFSAMASAPPAVDPNVSAVTAVWSYVAELAFNLLVLVGAVKMSDRIVKELLGL